MMNQAAEQQPSARIENSAVTSALNAILSTDKFSASPQMSAFLRYVVEQTLLGNTRRIKAFTVGIEALGKPPTFDPQTDPSVRVLAKRLRSSLDVYYEQNPNTPIFIEMKPGSYVPKFLLRSDMQQRADQYSQSSNLQEVAAPHPPAVATPSSAAPLSTAQQPPTHPAQVSGTGTHVNVPQRPTQEESARVLTQSEEEENSKEGNERKPSLGQLWKAYKSASKVA